MPSAVQDIPQYTYVSETKEKLDWADCMAPLPTHSIASPKLPVLDINIS